MAIFKRSKKNKKRQRGRFIVIDGIDGSGKTTQFELLKQELQLMGYKVEVIKFPRHSQTTAYFVDEYLKGTFGDLNPYAASIFYAVDRFEASVVIKNWLGEGKIVLADRYVVANAGHQGSRISDPVERLKFFKWLDNLEYNIFGIPKPDLNIILNMPAMTAYRLLKSRKSDEKHTDNMHQKSLTHLRQAQEAYMQIAKLFPNTKMVECLAGKDVLSPQEIHNKVWELVRRIALKDFKPQ